MKNYFIIGILLLLTGSVVAAQSEYGTGRDEKEMNHDSRSSVKIRARSDDWVVSYQTNQAFLHDFPEAKNLSWRVTGNFEEASFILDGEALTAYYDSNSELVGTTTEKSFTDLPANAQAHIRKQYSDYRPAEVILFDDNENNDTDMILYSTAFDDEDNYFVSLTNDKETIILKVNRNGTTSFFKKL